MATLAPQQHIAFLGLFTAAGLLALCLPFAWVSALLTAAYFLGIGGMLGRALLRDEPLPWQIGLGGILTVALTVAIGTVTYYAYKLTVPAVALVLLGTAGAAWGWRTFALRRAETRVFGADALPERDGQPLAPRLARTALGIAACAASLGLAWYALTLLQGAATDIAIRSPWDVVPRMFFPVLLFAVLAAVAAAAGGFASRLALLPTAALAALSVSVATLTYQVGFGFDPFIHHATELQILREGVIFPKPFYYVGHYALVTILARMNGGHAVAVDTWLIPAALAACVPIAYWAVRRALRATPSQAAAASAAILLLPLSSLVAPTPQGFANALFLSTALLALPAAVGAVPFPRLGLLLMAAATAAIHPLAGIPLGVFVLLVLYLRALDGDRGWRSAARWLGAAVLTLVGSVALPAMFMLNAAVSGAGVSVNAEAVRAPSAILEAFDGASVATRQFSAGYDLTYWWKEWRAALIALAALAGAVTLARRGRADALFAYGAAALAFMANYALLKSVIRFPFLISYEQSSYGDRMAELTLFVLAPLALVGVAALFARAAARSAAVHVTAALLLAGLAVSSVYLAYPRRDRYESSRGWSTSAADVEAVRSIEADAAGAPYVVLANQSVSAAAIRELGFKKYYGDVFFYPVPTGGPLYAAFLDANAAFGSRTSVQKAMDLAGVDRAYLVVSYYWWDARRIVVGAGKDADGRWSVNEKNYVFRYDRAAE